MRSLGQSGKRLFGDMRQIVMSSKTSRASKAERRDLRIPRGVVVVRYLKSGARRTPPILVLSVPAGSDAELVGLTYNTRQILAKPGNAVVVLAKRDTEISLEIIPAEGDESRDAEIAVERINAKLPIEAAAQSELSPPFPREAISDVAILAHVARQGDVLAGNGEWICGPRLPMSIEGIEVRLGRLASGLDVLVSGEARLRRPLAFPAASAGAFIGTRGRATPLTGLTFSLIGRWAGSAQLAVDALFLGSSVTTRTGNSIELCGPTGTEPLVGLRISLQAIQPTLARSASIRPFSPMATPGAAAPAQMPERSLAASQLAKQTADGSTSRVRVFRASAHGV
jgi:cell division protein FtsL